MNHSTKAIILCDANFDDLLLYSVETTFNFEALLVKSFDELLQSLTRDTFSLIVFSLSNDKELLRKINRFLTIKKSENNPINAALIIIGNYDQSDNSLKSILSLNPSTLVQTKVNILEISKFIIINFRKDDSFIEEEFSPISIKTLMRFKILSFPAYIKLKTRYLKVLSIGDTFFSDDVSKYHNKGITHLYLKEKTSKWILNQLDNHMDAIINNTTRFLEITVPPTEVPIEVTLEQPPLKEKINLEPTTISINTSIPKETTSVSISDPAQILCAPPKLEDSASLDEFKLKDSSDAITSSMGKPFQIEDDHIAEVKRSLNTIIKVVMKNPELRDLLRKLKINRSKSEYYTSHIGNLINVCTAVAGNIDWKTERTIEKLVYACYFHDAGLSEKPELSSIKTETEARARDLPANDLRLYLSHPTKIANLLRGVNGFPDDVHLIVEQHHESPAGNGFPKKITSTRIIPLSAVFILSHSLVDYIIDNEKWNITDYIEKAKTDFPGNAFRKIIQSLELIKDQQQ